MPDFVAEFGQRDPLHFGLSSCVEEAELDLRRMGGEQAEIHPASVPRGALRMGRAGTDLPGHYGSSSILTSEKGSGVFFWSTSEKDSRPLFRSQRIQAAQGAQDFGDAPGLRDTPAGSIRGFRIEYLTHRADARFAEVGRKRFEQRARRHGGRPDARGARHRRTDQSAMARPSPGGRRRPGFAGRRNTSAGNSDARDRASAVRTGSTIGRGPLRAPAASGFRRESDEAARWPAADSDGRRHRLPFRRPPRRKGAAPLRTRSGG